MLWLPFLRGLFPAVPPARHPVPRGTPRATPTESQHQNLSAEYTPSSIAYDPGLAQFLQDQFLSGVEKALEEREWAEDVPEAVVNGWHTNLPVFYAPLTKLTETPIRQRLTTLGPWFGDLVAALDSALGIQRGGKVEADPENSLLIKMRNGEGLAPDFYQRFDAVVGTTFPGSVGPQVELTVEAKPGSASKPAAPNGSGAGLFERLGSTLMEAVVLSSRDFEKVEAAIHAFVGEMIHGARFFRNRLFLYFDGITYGVGAITRAVEPPAPPTTRPQRLRRTATSSAPAQSQHPFSVLLTHAIPNGNGPTGRPADNHLPSDPPPPSIILVVLAALYPQFVDQDLLDARIQQIVDAFATSTDRRPVPVAEDAAMDFAGSPGTGPAAGPSGQPGTSSSARGQTAPSRTFQLVWPDNVCAALDPIPPTLLQLRLDVLQEEKLEPASSDDDAPPSLVTSSARSDAPPSSPFTPPVLPEKPIISTRTPLTSPISALKGALHAPAASGQVLALEKLIHSNERSFVYSGKLGERRVVAKIGRRGWEDVIIDEAAASMLALRRGAAVLPLLGSFAGRDPTDGRRIVAVVYPEHGDSPDAWVDLPLPQRMNLLLDLVYLHQCAHLEHGDAAPRNTLVDTAGTTNWIDLSEARAHASCKGVKCWELSEVCDEMDLWEEQEALREAANARGLRW